MVGSGEDPNKRIGMLWADESETTLPPPGTTKVEYAYPSVSDQEADPNSLLNYYRRAMVLRHSFPAIAAGTSTVIPCDADEICLIVREYAGEEILLIVNPSASPMQLSPSHYGADFLVLAAWLCTDPDFAVLLRQGSLRMPGYSIAVLTK